MVTQLPEHVERNRRHWDDMAAGWVEPGRRNWSAAEPTWGIWAIPESELHLLPDDLTGKDAIWCDPYAWVPEAARLLRPGGRLVFLGSHSILQLCAVDTVDVRPAGDRLQRDYFGMHRLEWVSDDSVEFALPYGKWFRLLRANGFEVEDLIELQAPAQAGRDFDFVTADWAKRWPSEHVIKAVKRG